MRTSLALFSLVLLGACSQLPLDTTGPTARGGSVVQNFIGPNGRQGYGLVCNSGIAPCFDDARKICANGFAVVGTFSYPAGGELLVECK